MAFRIAPISQLDAETMIKKFNEAIDADISTAFPTPAEAQEVLSEVTKMCAEWRRRRELEKASNYKLADLPSSDSEIIKKYFRIVQGIVKYFHAMWPEKKDDPKVARLVAKAKSVRAEIKDRARRRSRKVASILMPLTWQLEHVATLYAKERQ